MIVRIIKNENRILKINYSNLEMTIEYIYNGFPTDKKIYKVEYKIYDKNYDVTTIIKFTEKNASIYNQLLIPIYDENDVYGGALNVKTISYTNNLNIDLMLCYNYKLYYKFILYKFYLHKKYYYNQNSFDMEQSYIKIINTMFLYRSINYIITDIIENNY